jgi:hypothetical protein
MKVIMVISVKSNQNAQAKSTGFDQYHLYDLYDPSDSFDVYRIFNLLAGFSKSSFPVLIINNGFV